MEFQSKHAPTLMNDAHPFATPDVTVHCLHARATGSQREGAKVSVLFSWQFSFLVETSLGKSNFCLSSYRLGILSSQNMGKLASNPFQPLSPSTFIQI